MKFDQLHKWITYVISGLGLVALGQGGEVPPAGLAVLALAYVASWFAEAPLISNGTWIRGWTGIVVASLGIQVLRGFNEGVSFGLAVEFAALLTISRLFNRRTAADFQQIVVLAFLHLIAGTVLTTGIIYGLLFVGFVIVTPWMLALTHLRVEIEGHYPRDDDDERAAGVRRVLASRRIVGPAFLGWTAALALPLFLSALAMFVVFPRVGFGLVNLGESRAQSAVGFGDDIELGGFGTIRDNPTVVLRATPDRALAPLDLQSMLRFRGTTFDHYDGRRWVRSKEARVPFPSLAEHYEVRRLAKREGDYNVKVVLESLQEPVLFLPPGTVSLRIAAQGSPRRRRQRVVTRGRGHDLRYAKTDELGIVYTVRVSGDSRERELPVVAEELDGRYLQMPKDHARLQALAQRLTADKAEPLAKIRGLVRYLRDEGRFAYTLDQVDVGEAMPITQFLFESKRGHCEYFATALALMLRASGVPARTVNGFVGGEYNRFGNYYAVRQGDAHSWVEAYIVDRGWVSLDPTPPARAAAAAKRTLLTPMREMLDALRAAWMTRVIGYDLTTQISGLKKMRDWFKGVDLGGDGDDGKGAAGDQESAWDRRRLVRPMAVGLGVLLAGLGVWWWRRQRRLRREGQPPVLGADVQRARALYAEMEAVLLRRGAARPVSVTPEQHARVLGEQGFEGAEIVEEVTGVYIRTRFGGADLDAGRAAELSREVRRLRSAV